MASIDTRNFDNAQRETLYYQNKKGFYKIATILSIYFNKNIILFYFILASVDKLCFHNVKREL